MERLFYVSIMLRDENKELHQKFIDFGAENKIQAKKIAKFIADNHKARMLGFWEKN